MESQKHNKNSNVGKDPLFLSSNSLYGQNPPPISYNSLVELIPSVANKSFDRPMMKGQLGPQKQNKRAVPQKLENPESCKKMRQDIDKSPDSFIPWSPQAMESAKKAYLASKSSPTIDKAPTVPNSNGYLRKNDSGRAIDMNIVDKSLVGPNVNSLTQIIELDMQQTFGQPKGQLKHVPSNIPGEVVVMNNLDSSTRRIKLESIKSSENAEENLPRLVEDNDYPILEGGVPFLEFTNNYQTFKVVVNGCTIDSDLRDYIRAKYFELCSSQGSYLHAGLLKSIDSKFAVEIISKATEISEWIRNCNLSSNLSDFEERSTVLRGLEMFGMNLVFLLTRLNQVYRRVSESIKVVDLERCKNAKIERQRVEEEKKKLKSKLLELEMESMRLNSEIEAMEENADKHEGMIREEANAPW